MSQIVDLQPKTAEQISLAVEKLNSKNSRQEAKRMLAVFLPIISDFLLKNNDDNEKFQIQIQHLKAAFPNVEENAKQRPLNNPKLPKKRKKIEFFLLFQILLLFGSFFSFFCKYLIVEEKNQIFLLLKRKRIKNFEKMSNKIC